jgi:hypothetical protein
VSRRAYEVPAGLLAEEAEPALASVLDLLSDDAAGLDSALPPSLADFVGADFVGAGFVGAGFVGAVAGEDDSFVAGSFAPDSELAAFFRASDG